MKTIFVLREKILRCLILSTRATFANVKRVVVRIDIAKNLGLMFEQWASI